MFTVKLQDPTKAHYKWLHIFSFFFFLLWCVDDLEAENFRLDGEVFSAFIDKNSASSLKFKAKLKSVHSLDIEMDVPL